MVNSITRPGIPPIRIDSFAIDASVGIYCIGSRYHATHGLADSESSIREPIAQALPLIRLASEGQQLKVNCIH